MSPELELRAVVAIERIAECLTILVAEGLPETPSESCPHPDDQRISFGMTEGQQDWACRVCGYRTVPQ